jgi:hypothetical protein
MEHALAKLILVCSLLTTLFASVPMHPAQAQTTKQAMPAGLQETFLSASAKPFSTQGGTYTTELQPERLRFAGASGRIKLGHCLARHGARESGKRCTVA